MFITTSRSHLGFLPLQHENFEQQVGKTILDQRAGMFGVRILEHLIDSGEQGKFLIDENSVGDVIGSFLWPKNTRRIPAWRLGAWPVLTVGRRSTATDAGFGQAGTGSTTGVAGFGQAGTPPLFQEDRGNGGAKSELFLPIRSDQFDRDSRFRTRQFKKPKVGARVAKDPGARTRALVDVEVDAWPKFPVGWHGIALAADEETVQNDLFMPTDPRLVLVNSENADPESGSLLVELNANNEVDGSRMSRLHAAFRIVPGPAIFCGEPTMAKFGGKIDVGVLALNTFASGGSDQLPSGLLFGPGDGNDNVLAALASSRGGPIDLGVDRDRHRIGSAGRFPINQAHIWGGAIYRFGPSGAYDAPLLHHGRADLGFDALPEDLEKVEIESGGIVPVFFVYDGTIRHSNFCGQSAPGHQRWFAVIPDEESARPADPPESVNVDRGAPERPPPPLPPDVGNQAVPGAPRRIPPPPPPPDDGLQDPGAPPRRIPPPPPLDEESGLQDPGAPPRRIPPPLPPGGDDNDVDVDPGPPEQPCPPEGDPPVDVDRGGEETGPMLDGPCTSGPINGPRLLPPGEAAREAIFGPLSGPPQILFDATGATPTGPEYARGSLTPVQMQQLFSEGHQLYAEDRQTLRETRIAQKVAFNGAPNADRRQETFLETVRARGLTNLFFRASWLGDDAPNFPQWTGQGPGGGTSVPSSKARRIRREAQPIVARYEGWGNQNDTLMGFDYTDEPHASRYLHLGTSQGGVALLPPETSIDDLRRGVQTGESRIYFLLADNVDLAIGATPNIADGSVRGGWILRERQATNHLSFMRGKTAAPADADSVFRLDDVDNFHLDLGQGDADAAAGVGVIPIRNAGTNPTLTPANGVVLFASGGEIFVRDGAGVTTNLATGAGGGAAGNTITVTADYNVQTVDDVILVDASGTAGDITITLPENTTAADLDGARFTVKKIDASDSDVIVVGTNPLTAGGNLIDDAVSLTIANEDEAYEFTSDGTDWWITSEPDGARDNTRTFTTTTASGADIMAVIDDVLLVDTTANSAVITLPSVTLMAGRRITVKKIDDSANAVVVLTPGPELIDGISSLLVLSRFDATELTSDGSNWHVTTKTPRTRSCIAVSADTTLFDFTHDVVLVDASGGAVTITLPPTLLDLDGMRFTIKKTDSSANAVTIDSLQQLTSGANLLDGEFTQVLSAADAFFEFTQDGVAWFITADSGVTPGSSIGVDTVRTFTRTTAATSTTLAVTDDTLLVDASSGTATVNLPVAAGNQGKRFTVKKIDTSRFFVSLVPNGSDLIDGEIALNVRFRDAVAEVVSDGGTEWKLAQVPPNRGRDNFEIIAGDTEPTVESNVLLVSASGGPRTVTLPDVATLTGRTFWVKKTDTSDNAVTIMPLTSQTIDDESSVLITTPQGTIVFYAAQAAWHIIGSSPTGSEPSFGPIVDKTINTAGAVSVTSRHLRLSGTTADILTDLTNPGNLKEGDLIMIRPASGETIVVESGTGNIRLDNDVDLNLLGVNQNIVLAWNNDSSRFFQVSKGLGIA